MKRIIILNSYTLTDKEPDNQVRIKYFYKGLEDEGYIRGRNYQVEIIDSNSMNLLEWALKEKAKEKIDLIHAVGTPNAIIAARFTKDIPIVYYGAHPEGVGESECRYPNVCGLVLTLPFTYNYKSFRFLRKLLPNVKSIYVPFYEGTIFCPEIMAQKHRAFRTINNSINWMQMDCEYIGYKSLSGLCYIIGLNYFEFVYKDANDLTDILAKIESEDSLLMPYNDSVYCENAPELLIEASHRYGVPLLWNNNPEASQIGALAAIAGCFKEAGSKTGKIAGRILNGADPSDIGTSVANKSYGSINLNTAQKFNLQFPDEVLSYFDEVLN